MSEQKWSENENINWKGNIILEYEVGKSVLESRSIKSRHEDWLKKRRK